MWCWGNGMSGELGNGDTVSHTSPQRVGARTDWSDVSAGLFHTCALAGGVVYCWGFGVNVGDDLMPENEPAPTAVAAGTDWVAIDTGWRHSCGVRSSSPRFWCWGFDMHGELGVGATAGGMTTSYELPTEVTLMPAP